VHRRGGPAPDRARRLKRPRSRGLRRCGWRCRIRPRAVRMAVRSARIEPASSAISSARGGWWMWWVGR